MYSAIICIAKVSILVQFLRIFVPGHKGMIFWIIQFAMWTNVCFYIAIAITLIFQCTPREKIWHPYVQGRCINIDVQIVTSGSWNVISDISLLVIPLHSIWLLQIPIKRKLGVSAVFATGLLWTASSPLVRRTFLTFHSACVSSICRLFYSVRSLLTLDKLMAFEQLGTWRCVFKPCTKTFLLLRAMLINT